MYSILTPPFSSSALTPNKLYSLSTRNTHTHTHTHTHTTTARVPPQPRPPPHLPTTRSFTYTAEVYPTKIRNTGMGAGNAWSRVGGIMTPYFSQLLLEANKKQPHVGPAATYTVLTAAALVAGLFLEHDSLDVDMSTGKLREGPGYEPGCCDFKKKRNARKLA